MVVFAETELFIECKNNDLRQQTNIMLITKIRNQVRQGKFQPQYIWL